MTITNIKIYNFKIRQEILTQIVPFAYSVIIKSLHYVTTKSYSRKLIMTERNHKVIIQLRIIRSFIYANFWPTCIFICERKFVFQHIKSTHRYLSNT